MLEFPGIFVRLQSPLPKNLPVRVKALMKSQAVRSLRHNGTPAAYVRITARPPLRGTHMNKLLNSLSLLVAVGFLSTLAGCDLYFHDPGGGNDTWNYCGSDGAFQCQGDNCEWVSSTCPD